MMLRPFVAYLESLFVFPLAQALAVEPHGTVGLVDSLRRDRGFPVLDDVSLLFLSPLTMAGLRSRVGAENRRVRMSMVGNCPDEYRSKIPLSTYGQRLYQTM